jgi:hypothetical protein
MDAKGCKTSHELKEALKQELESVSKELSSSQLKSVKSKIQKYLNFGGDMTKY